MREGNYHLKRKINFFPAGMCIYRSCVNAFFSLGGMRFLKRKYNNDIAERTGIISDVPPGSIWIHAVSVGEVQSASSLIRRIKSRSSYSCIISTVTPTGRDMAHKLLDGLADKIIYSPFDSRKYVLRALDSINPSAYIAMETELWPEMLSQLKARNIPSFLANGRISEKSFRRMMHTKYFWQGLFGCIDKFMVRFSNDKDKFLALGVPEEKLSVTGDCKVDSLLDRRKNTSPEKWNWLKKGNSPLIAAGSTHEGEDDIVISAFRILRKDYPDARLVIVPRHPERALMTIASALPFSELHAELLSQVGRDNLNADIVVVDRIGVLFELYAACDAAFVGGSLVEKGGQNPFEPALFGLPAVHGPSMTDFPDTSRMDSIGASVCVNGASELARAWCELLKPSARAKSMRECSKYFATLGGAAERTWTEIESCINCQKLDRKKSKE